MQAELPPQEQLVIGGKRGFKPYRSTATALASAMFPATPTDASPLSQRCCTLCQWLSTSCKHPLAALLYTLPVAEHQQTVQTLQTLLRSGCRGTGTLSWTHSCPPADSKAPQALPAWADNSTLPTCP